MIAEFLEMDLDSRIDELLEGILSLFNSGSTGVIFSAGDPGEFITSVILMRSYDYALGAITKATPDAPYYIGMPVALGTPT